MDWSKLCIYNIIKDKVGAGGGGSERLKVQKGKDNVTRLQVVCVCIACVACVHGRNGRWKEWTT